MFGVGGESRRLAQKIRRQIEQIGDLGDPRVDVDLGQAAVLQRECQVLFHGHGVVDHRKLEHLRDVALLCRQRSDVDAVKQDFPREGVTMPEIKFSSVVLPQPDGPSSA